MRSLSRPIIKWPSKLTSNTPKCFAEKCALEQPLIKPFQPSGPKQILVANSVDPDKMAQYEPSCQDLPCLSGTVHNEPSCQDLYCTIL